MIDAYIDWMPLFTGHHPFLFFVTNRLLSEGTMLLYIGSLTLVAILKIIFGEILNACSDIMPLRRVPTVVFTYLFLYFFFAFCPSRRPCIGVAGRLPEAEAALAKSEKVLSELSGMLLVVDDDIEGWTIKLSLAIGRSAFMPSLVIACN